MSTRRLVRSRAVREFALAALALSVACGSSDAPRTMHRGFGAPAGQAAPPTPATAMAPGAPVASVNVPVAVSLPSASPVPPSLRPRLTDDDFTEDPTGDVARDPFRSYLLQSSQPVLAGGATHPTLMAKFRLEELKLTGVIWQGSVFRATFTDPQGHGWLVKRGDYIASNDAYVDLIDKDGVVLKIGNETSAPPADPTQPQQPQVTMLRKDLHPEDLTPTSTSP